MQEMEVLEGEMRRIVKGERSMGVGPDVKC